MGVGEVINSKRIDRGTPAWFNFLVLACSRSGSMDHTRYQKDL